MEELKKVGTRLVVVVAGAVMGAETVTSPVMAMPMMLAGMAMATGVSAFSSGSVRGRHFGVRSLSYHRGGRGDRSRRYTSHGEGARGSVGLSRVCHDNGMLRTTKMALA